MRREDVASAASGLECARRNHILAALPDAELDALLSDLEAVSVAPKQVVQAASQPIEYVYFPTQGVFSLVATLPDGSAVEAATTGDEGMLNVDLIFTPEAVASCEIMLQVPDGAALRLPAGRFRAAAAPGSVLARLGGSYAHLVLAQAILGVACNARHNLLDRCAKWLLLTHDRMHRDDFRLSHEVLATILGATRPTVTVVARALQDAGVISYTYGRVRVVDRKGLEQAACSCYSTIRQQFNRLR